MSESGAIRAGRAFIEIFAEDSKAQRTLAVFQKKVSAWGASITAIGSKVFAGGAAINTAFGFATKLFADMGSAVHDMAQRTGIGAESLSVLSFAAEQTGTNMEGLEGGIKKMNKLITQAAEGSDGAEATLRRLGLKIEDLNGLTQDQRMGLFADRIAQIKDPAAKAGMMMEVFGKSGTDLLPMLADGSKGLEEFRKQAEEFGLVMSTEDANAADDLGDSLDLMWRSVKMAAFHIGAALAPEAKELAISLAHGAKTAADWVREHKGLIVSAAKIASGMMIAGGSLMALGTAMKLGAPLFGVMRTGMTIFSTVASSGLTIVSKAVGLLSMSVAKLGTIIWSTLSRLAMAAVSALTGGLSAAGSAIMAMMTPVGILGFALVGLVGYFIYASGTIGTAISEIKGFFSGLLVDVGEAFGGIKAALMKGDISAAAAVLWSLLKLEWTRGVAAVNAIWQQGKTFFLETWQGGISTASGWFLNMFYGLKTAWIEVVAFMQNAWAGMVNMLRTLFAPAQNWLAKQFSKMFAKVQGLDENEVLNTLKEDQDRSAKASDAAFAQRKTQIESERKAARAENTKNWSGALEENNAMTQQRMNELEDRKAKSLKDAEDAVKKAREEFNKTNVDAKGVPVAGVTDRKKKVGVPDIDDLGGMKVSTSGTFNALALQGLSGPRAIDDIAKSTKATAGHTKTLAERSNTPGGVRVT